MEERLRELISVVLQAPENSLEGRRALHRLLSLLQTLPGLAHSSHPDYPHALNLTWLWVCRSLQRFDPQQTNHTAQISLQTALVNWINGYLKFRISDLPCIQPIDTLSLDANRQGDDGGTYPKVLETDIINLPLSGLEAAIEQEQQQQQQRLACQIQRYIEQDPEGRLRNCHLKDQITCNCQTLAQRLLLKYPPDKASIISRNLQTNYQTMTSHWKRNCLPLLQQIAQDFGYQPLDQDL